MVIRFRAILSIMDFYDGPLDIYTALNIYTTTTFYRDIFWFYRSHFVLFNGRKLASPPKPSHHLLTIINV